MIIFDIHSEEVNNSLILSIPDKLHEDLNYILVSEDTKSKDTRKVGKIYLYKNYFLASSKETW